MLMTYGLNGNQLAIKIYDAYMHIESGGMSSTCDGKNLLR